MVLACTTGSLFRIGPGQRRFPAPLQEQAALQWGPVVNNMKISGGRAVVGLLGSSFRCFVILLGVVSSGVALADDVGPTQPDLSLPPPSNNLPTSPPPSPPPTLGPPLNNPPQPDPGATGTSVTPTGNIKSPQCWGAGPHSVPRHPAKPVEKVSYHADMDRKLQKVR